MIDYMGDRHKYPPAGKCIYCGKTDVKLSDEHIIPFALGGNWILRKASCSECARKTQKIEEICTHERWGMFHPLRTKLNLQSRRGRARHKTLPVVVMNPDGTRKIVSMQSSGFPAIAFGLKNLPLAGILLDNEPSNPVQCEVLFRIMVPETLSVEIAEIEKGSAVKIGSFNLTAFFQLLAKIGYSYAAAELGTEHLLPMLTDIILGKTDLAPYLIGGDALAFVGETKPCLHRLELIETTIRNQRFTLAIISLFAQLGLPRYHVVVRQRLLNQ